MRKNFHLSPENKDDAREALRMLNGVCTLTEAVTAFLALGGNKTMSASDSLTIEMATGKFLAACSRKKLRPTTYEFYEQNLNPFEGQFDGKRLDEVSRDDVQAWLAGLPFPTASARQRSIRALYNYGLAQAPKWCSQNPGVGLMLDKPERQRVIKFLSVEQARSLMRKAREDLKPALAIMLFAGVRQKSGLGFPM
jgi:site-specific recombinase XerD